MTDEVRDLLVRVDASVALLRANLQGQGEPALARFEQRAQRMAQNVDRSIETMGGNFANFAKMAETAAQRAEQSFESSFNSIQRMAARAIAVPAPKTGGLNLGAAEAREAAQLAQQQALAYRLIEDAARRAATGEGVLTEETRLFLQAASAARIEAERHAAELLREAGALERLEAETAQAGAGLVTFNTRQTQLSTVSGQARAGMQQLSFQANDVAVQFAASTPALTIFAQQFPQIIQAISLMTTESKGLLSVLAGPWGLAFTAALVVATPFVAKLLEGNNELDKAVKKLRDDARQTELTAQANRVFTASVEGQIAAQRKLNEELDRTILTRRQVQIQQAASARSNLAAEEKSRKDVAQQLARVRTALKNAEDARGSATTREDLDSAAAAVDFFKSKAAALEAQLASLDASITANARAVREAEVPLIQGDVEASFDKRAAAVRRYNIELGNLNARLAIGAGNKGQTDERQADGSIVRKTITGIGEAEYRREFARISAARHAAESSNRESGRSITSSDAAAIVRSIGGLVNSADRSYSAQKQLYDAWVAAGKPKDNPVAKPGTSAHEKGNALDVQFGPGISPASLRKAFADQGVSLTKVFKERGHYHIEWSKAQSSEAGDQAAQQKELDEQISFNEEMRRARGKLLGAQQESATTALARVEFEREEINAEAAAAKTRYDLLEQKGKLTRDEANELRGIVELTRKERLNAMSIGGIQDAAKSLAQKALDTMQARYEAELSELDSQIAVLRIRQSMATTAAERRRIGEELLAAEQQERRRRLEAIRDTSNDPKAVAGAIADLNRLPNVEDAERAQLEQQNLSPWKGYLRDLRGEAADFGEELERGGVSAAQDLRSELARAVVEGGNLGDVLEESVKRFLIKLAELELNDAFQFLATGNSSSGGLLSALGIGNARRSGLADLGSLLGSGSNSAAGLGDLGSLLGSFGGFRKNGGGADPRSWYVVGEDGPEIFVPDAPGTVIPNRAPTVPSSAMRSSAAAPAPALVRIEMVEGQLFEPRVREISGKVTTQVGAAAAQHGELRARQSLSGR